MKALELKKHILKTGSSRNLLIFGGPGTGKTALASTIARSEHIQRVFWFSLDNGHDTIVCNINGTPLLSDKELDKIEIYTVVDEHKFPRAWELVQNVIASKTPINIHANGDIAVKASDVTCEFPGWKNLGEGDCVVFDQITQLGMSIHNYNIKRGFTTGKGAQDTWKVYAEDSFLQDGFLKSTQYAKFPVICLAQMLFDDVDPEKKKQIDKFPAFGSKNFSIQTASYFHNVVALLIEGREHIKGSTPTWREGVIARSRLGVKIEKSKDINICDVIFPKELK